MTVYSIFVRALIWITSALSAVVGFSAISVAVFGTLRSRSKRPYVLLIVFYGAYTLQTFMTLMEEFVFSGGVMPSALTLYVVSLTEIGLGITVVVAAALYFHDLFSVAARRLRDILVVTVACAAFIMYGVPFWVSMERSQGIIILGPAAYAAGTVYLLLFIYLLAVGFLGSKRDRPARELVLIWTTLVFGSVGLVESLIGTLGYLRDPIVHIASSGSFPISSIPHILMGAVMIYYFGGYIMADRPPTDGAVPEALINKYNISQREREVIALMDRGLGNREIAEKLFVSLATVKTHAHNIYEKTGAKSRYGLSHMIRAYSVGGSLPRGRVEPPKSI